MQLVFGGMILLAIGLIRGDSVFWGDFTVWSVPFDVLGVYFIIRGIQRMRASNPE